MPERTSVSWRPGAAPTDYCKDSGKRTAIAYGSARIGFRSSPMPWMRTMVSSPGFNQRGGLGRVSQLFGVGLEAILDELNGALTG